MGDFTTATCSLYATTDSASVAICLLLKHEEVETDHADDHCTACWRLDGSWWFTPACSCLHIPLSEAGLWWVMDFQRASVGLSWRSPPLGLVTSHVGQAPGTATSTLGVIRRTLLPGSHRVSNCFTFLHKLGASATALSCRSEHKCQIGCSVHSVPWMCRASGVRTDGSLTSAWSCVVHLFWWRGMSRGQGVWTEFADRCFLSRPSPPVPQPSNTEDILQNSTCILLTSSSTGASQASFPLWDSLGPYHRPRVLPVRLARSSRKAVWATQRSRPPNFFALLQSLILGGQSLMPDVSSASRCSHLSSSILGSSSVQSRPARSCAISRASAQKVSNSTSAYLGIRNPLDPLAAIPYGSSCTKHGQWRCLRQRFPNLLPSISDSSSFLSHNSSSSHTPSMYTPA